MGTATPRLAPHHHHHRLFQYPRSDRGHCNVWLRRRSSTLLAAFQYPRSDRGHCNLIIIILMYRNILTFSILGRIVGTATAIQPIYKISSSPAFQYPRSDRGHCNRRSATAIWSIGCAFQYPRSDRGHCNVVKTAIRWLNPAAFSILGRIVGTATLDHPLVSLHPVIFQYPRSDRGHCNKVGHGQR